MFNVPRQSDIGKVTCIFPSVLNVSGQVRKSQLKEALLRQSLQRAGGLKAEPGQDYVSLAGPGAAIEQMAAEFRPIWA